MTKRIAPLAVVVAVAALAAGCGSATPSTRSTAKPVNPNGKETSPPGDIPDNQAFVRFAPAGGGFSVRVPEGWARSGSGANVRFEANLNSISIEERPLNGGLSAAVARSTEVPAMARSLARFRLVSVSAQKRNAGAGVRIRYDALGQANPVTGKAAPQSAERWLFSHNGHEVVLTLSGPKGADNVDPWRIVTDSLRWGN
jgi:hypothetical protein